MICVKLDGNLFSSCGYMVDTSFGQTARRPDRVILITNPPNFAGWPCLHYWFCKIHSFRDLNSFSLRANVSATSNGNTNVASAHSWNKQLYFNILCSQHCKQFYFRCVFHKWIQDGAKIPDIVWLYQSNWERVNSTRSELVLKDKRWFHTIQMWSLTHVIGPLDRCKA